MLLPMWLVGQKDVRIGAGVDRTCLKNPTELISEPEFWERFHILNGIFIHLVDGAPMSIEKRSPNVIFFSKEQFNAGLLLPFPSFFKQFLHYTKIPPDFIHPNVVRVLMGCNILDILFQLNLSLSEVLFVYIVKMSQKERFSLDAHIPSLQLVTRLPNLGKGGAKGHVLVSSPWSGPSMGPDKVFTPLHSLEILSRIYLYNFCPFFAIISSSL